MPSSLASRSALLLVLCAAWPAAARASDVNKPYTIRIVVDVAEHRLLTDVFKQQLQRDLRDGVQAALGKLARVEVTDKHDALADIRAHGLQKALDNYREAEDAKVHFVRVELHGTRYEIQARQYDGELRLASPVVRRERRDDRAFVARAAALLIEQDIGITGTIVSEPDGSRRVKVEWKAGELGELGRWLKKGEVLAVAAPASAPQRALPWTLLQVETEPRDGASTCLLFSRYQQGRVSGLRCMLLGTRSGSVRLKLLEAKREGGVTELQSNVRLEFRRRGFDGEESTKIAMNTSDEVNTAAHKDGKFERVVFVNVLSGGTVKARMPIPLIDDRIITLTVPPDDEGTNEVLDRHRALARNALAGSLVLANSFEEINALTADSKRRAEAMVSVKQTLQRSREDHERLSRERNELDAEVRKLEARRRPSFDAIDARLTQLKSVEERLLKHVKLLEKIEQEEADPKRKEWKFQLEQAKGYLQEAEVEKAIAAYKQALAQLPDEGVKQLARIEQEWKPANEQHATARDFIFRTYPNLSTADLAARWKQVEDAFAKCKDISDRWGPLKLYKATEKHRGRILKEGEALKPNLNPDDEKPAQLIADLVPKVRKLDDDVKAYLARRKGD